uniref:Mitotic checkpoint regulator, MAD2B-interacting-domain-containing protein n=1 Tax=Kwoniella pini CBS 10737 TaxID=1296096 RepID=A0A1B9IBP7_9TREE|nr:uncharacterized protein I206_00151 [Kwoniella pini CBS 10737]OCF52853.1 hypothetical protein I206_00151 [Kwoniella pini CBS 10737]
MLLANYASDSDSDAGSDIEASSSKISAPAPPLAPKPVASTGTVKAPINKAKKPVKITLGLPKSSDHNGELVKDVQNGIDGDIDEEREVKKSKITGGKGSSSLLGMLPPPKRKLPQASTSKASSLKIKIPKPLLSSTKAAEAAGAFDDNDDDEDDDDKEKSLPPSLARKAQKKKEEESFDLFGLSSSTAEITLPSTSVSSSSTIKPPTISSAPLAPDYIPPEPTSNDPYPGYYKLPSGEWKAYDPEYYNSFFTSNNNQEEEEEDGRVGKHWKEFNDGQFKGNLLDVNATSGIAEARAQEQINNMAKRQKVNENEFEYKPIGQVKGLASQRHQLTSLLNTAYTQREELEDRIAQNKKNMRMAGTKYGF